MFIGTSWQQFVSFDAVLRANLTIGADVMRTKLLEILG
jgi:hypothetical protein